MSFGTLPRFWAGVDIAGSDMSQNAGVKLESFMVPTIPVTAGNVVEILCRAPCTGLLAGGGFSSVSALATAAGDNVAAHGTLIFSAVNKGANGAGTTVLLATTPAGINSTNTTGGAAIVAYTPFLFTMAALPAGNVNSGDIIDFKITTGTGASATLANTVTGGVLWLAFLPTS